MTKGRKILRYAILPGIIPIMKELGGAGFSHIAFFMASVLQAVKLLPALHPYTNSANIGRFGIRHVLAESGRNLVFDRHHIDQVAVYLSILTGLVILLIQCCLLLLSFIITPALAAMPANYAEFFITANPTNDIAFIMLDRVFGVGDMFNSCVAQGVPCLGREEPDGSFPYPFHFALHSMFRIYSLALMVIAVLIFCYFIMAIVTETAQDGTPFGRRFNHVWAPIRMVVALGLLVPIGTTGLNSGQYITLYAAKWGSGFATNAWILFNEVLTGTYLNEKKDLIATPEIPELDRMIQFMLTAQTCRAAHVFAHNDGKSSYKTIEPYIVKSQFSSPSSMHYIGTSYEDALKFTDYENIIIHFGYIDKKDFWKHRGFVKPICGSFIIPVVDLGEPGAKELQREYYEFFRKIYLNLAVDGYTIARRHVPKINEWNEAPIETDKMATLEAWEEDLRKAINDSIAEQITSGNFAHEHMGTKLEEYGWAGASIWYNRLARMNGAVTTAVFNIPRPKLWTEVLEEVKEERQQHDSDTSSVDRFNRKLAGDFKMEFQPAVKNQRYNAEYDAYDTFETEDGGRLNDPQISQTNNILIDIINYIFGTEGLFNIRQNADIHPLAQLSAVGKGLIESTLRNIGLSAGAGALLVTFHGNTASIASSLLLTAAMVGLTAGFALFYVIPFLPFLYFFFSACGWIKGIFEAMVGVPLWALAHIRIDGQGLPGDAAANGYFLIFEIFLRPILMLFGLLGSILIFAALVRVLNDTFDLVVHNLSGYDIKEDNSDYTDPQFYRGAIDEFFFTIIYTIIVYMVGVSAFKMVYLVPNQILRWMGSSVSTFGDQTEDPTSGLMQTVAIGGGSLAGQLAGAAKQGGQAVSLGVQAAKGQSQ